MNIFAITRLRLVNMGVESGLNHSDKSGRRRDKMRDRRFWLIMVRICTRGGMGAQHFCSPNLFFCVPVGRSRAPLPPRLLAPETIKTVMHVARRVTGGKFSAVKLNGKSSFNIRAFRDRRNPYRRRMNGLLFHDLLHRVKRAGLAAERQRTKKNHIPFFWGFCLGRPAGSSAFFSRAVFAGLN